MAISDPGGVAASRPSAGAAGGSTELADELLHLLELAQEPVHVRYGRPAAGRDPPAAAGLDDVRFAPLGRCHGIDDRLDPRHLAVVDGGLGCIGQAGSAGHHLEDLTDGSHLLDLLELAPEVLEREPGFHQSLSRALGLVAVEPLLCPLDEGDDVPHPEDALREPVWMEDLERVHRLARAHERDRQPGHRSDAEGSPAAGIAVHLGQDQAGERQPLEEGLRHPHRLLAGHGIHDEERLGRVRLLHDLAQLGHHRPVDVLSAGGVHDHQIGSIGRGRPIPP